MLKFDDLQRRLRDADTHPHIRYIISTLYEQQMELQKQFDAFTDLLVHITNTMEGLSAQQQLSINASMKSIKSQRDDSLVSSVTNDPDNE